ncbi:hypothetical protein GF402_01720 [Candidatus Fermentibacteria bacterium]|nr:hypothetical protein [Candidatus Fermentibacteria bacterium]
MQPEPSAGKGRKYLSEPYEAVLLLVAILSRGFHYLYYLLSESSRIFYWPVLGAYRFEAAAELMLSGGVPRGPFVYAGPLFQYVVLPFYATGMGRELLFAFNSLCGIFLAWLIYRSCRLCGTGRVWSLLIGLAWVLYAPALFYELTPLPVTFLTLTVALFVWLVMRQGEKAPAGTRSFLYGLLGGVLAGLRPPFAAVVMVPFLRLLKSRRLLRAGLLVAGVAVPVLFLCSEQKRRGKDFWPFPRSAGLNLLLGHNSDATGYGPPVPSEGLVESPGEDIHQVALRVARERGYEGPSEADRYWMGRALEWIVEHPQKEVELILRKMGGFFGAKPFDTYYDQSRVNRFGSPMRLAFMPRWGLMGIFLLGLVPFCLAGRRRVLLLLPVGLALAANVAFVHSERYFLPILPQMLVVGGSGLGIVAGRLRKGRWKWLGVALSGLALAVPSALYPVPQIAEEAYLYGLAVRAYNMGNHREALSIYERAAMSAEEGTAVYFQAHGEAARIARALGMDEKAREHERALGGNL